MTSSGNAAREEPSGGVTQPFTHVSVTGPPVGGGRSGSAGGVTDGVVEGIAVGDTGGGGVVS
jgi:hypothetical protein